jgi:hypothetical protein
MVLYFDIIPEELNQIILFKIDINLYDDLYKLSIFKSILDKGYFWNFLLKVSTKNINYNLIPNYLYNYNDNLFNYMILINAYNKTKKQINYYIEEKEFLSHDDDTVDDYDNLESFWKYDMKSINNFNILTLGYTNKVNNDIEDNINKIFKEYMINYNNYTYTILLSLRTKGHVFILSSRNPRSLMGEYEYVVSLQDIFNALLHITLNGDPALEY